MAAQTASLSVKVTPSIRDGLKEIADSKSVSVHRLISDLVSDFVQVSLKDRERELQAIAVAESRRLEMESGTVGVLTLAELKAKMNESVNRISRRNEQQNG